VHGAVDVDVALDRQALELLEALESACHLRRAGTSQVRGARVRAHELPVLVPPPDAGGLPAGAEAPDG
jgi:hypothetical protein